MNQKVKAAFIILGIIEVILIGLIFLSGTDFKILNPQGFIAREERNLMLTAIFLMLIVALPVYFTVFFTAFKYRDKGQGLKTTESKKNKSFNEFLWWIPPTAVILIIASITYGKTHLLDPYRPLDSSVRPIKVQVVALNWKWLFIYPEEKIATVNFLEFPEKTPINFELSSDGPMNSFWIPSLSGQIYAMTGMSTKLHMLADHTGDFKGSAAEINGRGFSGMNFTVRAVSEGEYKDWIAKVKDSPKSLSSAEYKKLSIPSENNPAVYYSSVSDNLYNEILSKYMSKDNMHHE